MTTSRMTEKIRALECVDLSAAPREGKHYVVTAFIDDMDYCVLDKQQWIWSIGRRRSDGVILASTAGDLYQNPEFECLWLR
jgi:hypothetical protein